MKNETKPSYSIYNFYFTLINNNYISGSTFTSGEYHLFVNTKY